jgi:glycosyltransferase involved in cell wall biosynthesis
LREVARVIVADSPSSDATAARAAGAGADVIRGQRGYGRARMAGVIAAPEADMIVFMDGDGADDPARRIQARLEDLPRQLMSTDQITANELKPCLLQTILPGSL